MNKDLESPHPHKGWGFLGEMTTLQRITEIIVDQLGIDESDILPTSDIVSDLGADSLDRIELVMILEEEFDLEIPDEEAEPLRTVQQIVDYVDAHTA